jgi:hypothetical protein
MDKEKISTILFNKVRLANSTTSKLYKPGLRWIKLVLSLGALILPAVLNACTLSTSASTQTIIPAAITSPLSSATPAPTFTPVVTQVPTNGATNMTGETGTPITLDPCVLLPKDEASSLAGTSFGDGKPGTLSGEARNCTYGANTTNVLYVEVAQAKDITSAQAYKDQFLADLQADMNQFADVGLNITQVPDFADGAVIATASATIQGVTISGSAIGFLKGRTFFGFSDIVAGTPAPSTAALKTEAEKVLNQLPTS